MFTTYQLVPDFETIHSMKIRSLEPGTMSEPGLLSRSRRAGLFQVDGRRGCEPGSRCPKTSRFTLRLSDVARGNPL
jgi:hypothetical protein